MTTLGTQTFGLKKEFTDDLHGTIRALHEIGFETIEPLILFSDRQGRMPRNTWALDTLDEAKHLMDELGMRIPSAHIGIGIGWFSMPIGKVTKSILTVHEKYGIDTFIISGLFSTAGLERHWAKLIRRINEEVRTKGCKIAYHNHDDEFARIHGCEALSVFFDEVGEDVALQLDIGWAGLAGDEVKAAERYADRIISLHLKDFYSPYKEGGYTQKTVPTEAFAPMGEGSIRIPEILSMRDRFPNFSGSILIDQDKYTGNMLESLRIGHGNVRHMLAEAVQ